MSTIALQFHCIEIADPLHAWSDLLQARRLDTQLITQD